MSSIGLIIIGLVILVGIIGAVVQVWPSSPFIGGAIFVWAWMTGTGIAWTVFAIAAVLLGVAAILKYTDRQRRNPQVNTGLGWFRWPRGMVPLCADGTCGGFPLRIAHRNGRGDLHC